MSFITGIAKNITSAPPCRASSSEHLRGLIGQQKGHMFTLIQKFNQDVDPAKGWSQRDDIIVISDEAHRTQYGRLALNMRNALPRACYIGFTGTPLFGSCPESVIAPKTLSIQWVPASVVGEVLWFVRPPVKSRRTEETA